MILKGDFSSINNNFGKYIASFVQQGRLHLDSDLNANALIFLNSLWNQSRDIFGESSCLGDSFRIGKDIVIDHMIDPNTWSSFTDIDSTENKDNNILLDTNNIPYPFCGFTSEKGCILVKDIKAIERNFDRLDLSKFKCLFLKFKILGSISKYSKKGSNFKIKLTLYSQPIGGESSPLEHEYVGHVDNISDVDQGGFFNVVFNIFDDTFSEKLEDNDFFNLSSIIKMSINWQENKLEFPVCVGLLTGEPLVTVVGTDSSIEESSNWLNNPSVYSHSTPVSYTSTTTTAAAGTGFTKKNQQAKFETFNSKPTIYKINGINQLIWNFNTFRNFNSLNCLRFVSSSVSKEFKPVFFALSSGGKKIEFVLEKKR